MPWSRYVLGFHGCDTDVAKQVAAGLDDLKSSRIDYDWLGHGLYFWEDGHERALRWAREQSERPGSNIKSPAVLGPSLISEIARISSRSNILSW